MAATATVTDTRKRTLDRDHLSPLESYLRHVWQAQRVTVESATVLSGGAVQENWRLTLVADGGLMPGRRTCVLRTDARARLAISLDRSSEYRVLVAAHRAGVRVAEPLLECADGAIVGAPFMLQDLCEGTADARALTRAPDLEEWGADAVFALGRELAKIHTITPATAAELTSLPVPIKPPAANEVERLRSALDGSGDPRPALEYILTWLTQHAPSPPQSLVLVHGDYRTGNLIHQVRTLEAVLDWEFAHWGDPAEDIGWFCARCWRFGNDHHEAGGLGSRQVFYDGYRSVAPLPADGATVPYWEIMAAAKWAAVSVLQGDRYRHGGEDALELVLTGLMAPEMELDALLQIETLGRSLPK